jgi:hypothetical protein
MLAGMTTAPTRPPFADASPAEVRAALLPEEQPDFDREYQHALEVAAATLRLDELEATLRTWRRVAWSTSADPAGHRRMLRTAAGRLSGQPIPAAEPLTATKARLGL